MEKASRRGRGRGVTRRDVDGSSDCSGQLHLSSHSQSRFARRSLLRFRCDEISSLSTMPQALAISIWTALSNKFQEKLLARISHSHNLKTKQTGVWRWILTTTDKLPTYVGTLTPNPSTKRDNWVQSDRISHRRPFAKFPPAF